MKKTASQPTIFSIYANDKKGLIGQMLVHFNNRNYDVLSLNVARTDISDLVLVTIEAITPASQLNSFKERLKKIVEVYTVQTFSENLKKTGFYSLALSALDNDLWLLIAKYGAQLSSMGEGAFVITKTGSDDDLEELYRRLEGPTLLGFCKNGLIVEQSLNLSNVELSELGSDKAKQIDVDITCGI